MSTSNLPSDPLPKLPLGSLSEQVKLIESEIAELSNHLKLARAAIERQASAATLRSREQAAEMLNASTAQVGRWTASGELCVIELDRRPRYRVEDIQAFAASRVRGSRHVSLATRPDISKDQKGLLPSANLERTQKPKHENRNCS